MEVDSLEKKYRTPSIKENVIWNTCGSLIYFGTQWLITVILFRQLGAAESGVFQLCMTLATVFLSIALFGMRNYQVSDVNMEYDDKVYKGSRIYTLIVTMIVSVIFVICNGYTVHKSTCIILYMIFKLSEALVDVYHGIDQRKMKMDYVGISYALRGILSFVVFVVICSSGGSLELAITGMAVSVYAVIILFDIPMCRRLGGGGICLDYKKIMPLLITCIPLVCYYFFINGTASVSKYILEKDMGSDVFGYYTSVATPAVIVQTAATFIYAPFVTELSNQYAKGDIKAYKRLINTVSLIILVICIGAVGGGWLLGEPVLVMILGENIREWTFLFVPIIISTCVIAYSWFISTVLIVIRRLKWLLIITAAGFGVCAAISHNMIDMFGPNGATYSIILSQMCMIICYIAVIVIDMRTNKSEKRIV